MSTINNMKGEVNRPIRNEDIEVAVLSHVQMDPTQSVRKISEASSVHRIGQASKFHLYKITRVQELNEDDPDRHLQFCELFTQQVIDNQNLLHIICFSDECTLMVNGEVNTHNCRYWSDINLHWFRVTHTQHSQKLNVWAGILGDHTVGPLFIDSNLNGATYQELLENTIDPMITEILVNDDNLIKDQIIFQHDGAPPHYAVQIREFLNERFPARGIGRRGAIE